MPSRFWRASGNPLSPGRGFSGAASIGPAFVRAAATSTATGGNTISPAKPTVDGASGRMLALVNCRAGGEDIVTATAGWTRIDQISAASNTTAAIFEAAESAAAPTFTWTSGADAIAQLVYYKSTSAMGAAAIKNSAYADFNTVHTSASYTTSAANALDVYADTSWASITGLDTPAGFTEDSQSAAALSFMNTFGSQFLATSGSSAGAISVSNTGGNTYWRMFRVQLA